VHRFEREIASINLDNDAGLSLVDPASPTELVFAIFSGV
jgi:hypothetical protein